MKPVILDCSITMSWCFRNESTEYTDSILHYVRKESAIVPSLWHSEVTNVLLAAIKRKRMDWMGALTFLEAIARLPIRVGVISSKEYFSKIIQLAHENHLSTYDATYLHLALREKKPLATLDSALKFIGRKYRLPKIALN